MTAYTVFREVKKGKITLNSPVLVTAYSLTKPPSKMGFPLGSVLTVDNALKILMVKSANDIAVAIAESVGGSEKAFVDLMNGYARELGMDGSHFVNPHGLHHDAQYTTARDLAVLTTALRKEFPGYDDYFDIPAIQVGGRAIANHNQLLFRYRGTTGMKTGFVCASGLNVVVTAKRGPRELIAVVLGGPTSQERNVRAAKLLNDSFLKNTFLIKDKLETMRPSGFYKTVGTNMRDIVCKPRSKSVKQEAIRSNIMAFAGDEGEAEGAAGLPSLNELEEKLLGPRLKKLPAAGVIRVALGDATGPDPFGLLVESERLTEIRKKAEAEAAAKAEARKKARAAAKKKKKSSKSAKK
jgi:D-alanyl-D-alanine carboxypeptidase